jgi:hypothetical protein
MLITFSNNLFQSFAVQCRISASIILSHGSGDPDPYLKNRDPEHLCSMFYTLRLLLVFIFASIAFTSMFFVQDGFPRHLILKFSG